MCLGLANGGKQPKKMTDKQEIKLFERCTDMEFMLCRKSILKQLNRQQAEIERLKNSGIRANSVEDWLDYCNGLKSEAIKECLDRIEAFLCGVCGSVVEDNPNLDRILFGYNTEEVDAFIDNLRKEMVGE